MADRSEVETRIAEILRTELSGDLDSVSVVTYQNVNKEQYEVRGRRWNGDKASLDMPDGLDDLLVELRDATYDPVRGAWFTATVELDSGGRLVVDLDYDGEPRFDLGVSDGDLIDDLVTYPRGPEHVPDWYPKLPEGGPRPLRPLLVDEMFRPGTRYVLPNGRTAVAESHPGGTLRLPTGRLVAADPGVLDDGDEPFTVAVDPGEYAVVLAVVRFEDEPGHRRVSGAKLAIRDEPVDAWELALIPGQDAGDLGHDSFFGYSVDTGTGCFLDAAALPALVRRLEEDPDALYGFDRHETGELADPDAGANLLAFSTGWGDGAYPTWIGRTAAGDVACFVTDTLVLHAADPLP